MSAEAKHTPIQCNSNEARRKFLWTALTSRALTDAELEEALAHGDYINLQAGVPFYASEKTIERCNAFRVQNLMRLDADKAFAVNSHAANIERIAELTAALSEMVDFVEDAHFRSLPPIPPPEPTNRDWGVANIVIKTRALLAKEAKP